MRLYKYCLNPGVSEQYAILFGAKRNVINELNQLMSVATKYESKESSTIYLHKKRNILIEIANDRRVILGVAKAPTIDELKKGARKYDVCEHAIDRAIERLGLAELTRSQVAKTINDRMQTAVFTGEVAKGRVFDHYASRSRFIVAKDDDRVITTYSMDTVKTEIKTDSSLGKKVLNLINRELKKAGAAYRKQQREITAVASELKIAIAKDELNALNAKAPHIKAIIQSKLDENTTKLNELMVQLDNVTAEYEAKKAEAAKLLGGEL